MAGKELKEQARQVYQDLKEDPLHKFNLAFALMSLIPILCFMYILAGEFFSIKIFTGNVGLIVFIAILISLLGFSIGHLIVRKLLFRITDYMIKLKENDKQKSIFVANVSHEIKNPLVTLRLAISTISDSIIDKIDDEQKEMLSRCKNLCDRLINFSTELLNISRIESGKFELRRSLFEINKLIDEVVKFFEPTLSRKEMKLLSNSPFPRIEIWGDYDKLSLVLSNIIDNAIKYTTEKGTITINLINEETNIRIEISDTGLGIPEERLDKIFNKFDRISSKIEGSGVGLSITKDIVELHKGRILVESKLKEGSKFTVILPKDLRLDRR